MKNEYCITWKLYQSWAFENLLKGARLAFLIFWSLFGLILLWLGLSDGFNIFFIILAIYCFYRTLLRNFLFAKRQYQLLAKSYGKENWIRTITFEDECILLMEGPMSVQYQYADIVDIRERDNKIWLMFTNKTVIRLYKNTFVDSDWAECKTLLSAKRLETAGEQTPNHAEKKGKV